MDPYLTRPPWQRILDVVLRSALYLSICMFAVSRMIAPRAFIDYAHAEDWYYLALHLGAALAAMAGCVAVARQSSQSEYVALPFLLGFLSAVMVLSLGARAPMPHMTVQVALLLFCGVRWNVLHNIIKAAREMQKRELIPLE